MKLDLSWAQRRFLGLIGQGEPSDTKAQFPLDLHLSYSAVDCFVAHLEMASTHRSGPLYGHRRNVTEVAYAMTGTPPGRPLDDLFALDAAYTLGASEALRLTDPSLDWVGHWVCAPGGLILDEAASVALIEQAGRLKLVDQRSPLVIVGWDDYEFCARPYLLSAGTVMPMRASLPEDVFRRIAT